MNPQSQVDPQAVNDSHGAVDLGQLKARAHLAEQFEAQRSALTRQLLVQAGLVCPCGNRIRNRPTLYYSVVDQEFPQPDGSTLPGLNILTHTCCSQTCEVAIAIAAQAIALREGPAGPITWLDERRAALAESAQAN